MTTSSETSTATGDDAESANPADPHGEATNQPGKIGRVSDVLSRCSGVIVLAAFIILFAIWVPETFLTATTAQSILGDQAVIGVVAIGLVFALSAGAFDISFAANLGLSGVVVSMLMTKSGLAPSVAIPITLLVGAAIGAANALFVVRVGVNPIIVTLGMSSILAAANSKLSDGGQFINGLPESFTDLAAPRILGIPVLALYLIVTATLAWYVLEHTPLGRRIQATGAGPDAARLAGVSTGRMTLVAFVIAGALASLAGVLATAKIGTGSPDVGAGYLLPVFAAVYLGTTQIKPGRFNIWGTLLAILLLATGVKGLQLAGGEPWITDAFNGVALILAVSLAAYGQRRKGGKLKAVLQRRKS